MAEFYASSDPSSSSTTSASSSESPSSSSSGDASRRLDAHPDWDNFVSTDSDTDTNTDTDQDPIPSDNLPHSDLDVDGGTEADSDILPSSIPSSASSPSPRQPSGAYPELQDIADLPDVHDAALAHYQFDNDDYAVDPDLDLGSGYGDDSQVDSLIEDEPGFGDIGDLDLNHFHPPSSDALDLLDHDDDFDAADESDFFMDEFDGADEYSAGRANSLDSLPPTPHRHHNHYEPYHFQDGMNAADRVLLGGDEDELVEIEVGRRHNARDRNQRQPRALPDVIDLTGDSPPQRPADPDLSSSSQNPRRRRLRHQDLPPQLARSDGNYVGGRHVIDLISDDDDDDDDDDGNEDDIVVDDSPVMNNANNNARDNRNMNRGPGPRGGSREARPGEHPRPRHQRHQEPPALIREAFPPHRIPRGLSHFFNVNIFPIFNNPRADDDLVMMDHRNLPPLPQNPAPVPAFGQIQLDYIHHPFNRGGAHGGGNGKPAHEPPKPARPGFTRDTDDDVVAVCPSCEQELAYDPDGEENLPGTPAKKARSKKDKAEHHFWAVKACGHVYCKRCFDNRKPSGKNPIPVSFRPHPSGVKTKILCAVDECDSEVGPKTSWVGIFL